MKRHLISFIKSRENMLKVDKMGKNSIIAKNILNTINSDNKLKSPSKAVISFLAELISDLQNNSKVTKEDKDFLQSMADNIYVCEYLKFNSNEYKKIKDEYEEYKQYRDSSNEVSKIEQLIRNLRILVSNYNILHSKEITEFWKNAVKKLEQQTSSKIKKLDKTIDEKLVKSEEMLGDIADNSNAKRYLDFASTNRISARWLFWISIVLMVAVAVISICILWNIESINELKLWVRVPLTFLILLPAFFMMRESKKLKDKEFQYYDMACRIITSGPYIDSLHIDIKEKDKLKANLVKDFFGCPLECRDDGGLPPIENICEVIKACLEKK